VIGHHVVNPILTNSLDSSLSIPFHSIPKISFVLFVFFVV